MLGSREGHKDHQSDEGFLFTKSLKKIVALVFNLKASLYVH